MVSSKLPARWIAQAPRHIQNQLANVRAWQVHIAAAIPIQTDASGYLKKKTEGLIAEQDYLRLYRVALHEIRDMRQMDESELERVMTVWDEAGLENMWEMRTMKRHLSALKEDMKQDQSASVPWDASFAELTTLRGMKATAERNRAGSELTGFMASVLRRYRVVTPARAHCAITGWQPWVMTRPARLVPKALESRDLARLFGDEDILLSDPRNGLLLHACMELALDQGVIAIVPVQPMSSATPMNWKVLLVDEAKRAQTAYEELTDTGTGRKYTWGEVDGRELVFLNGLRPARRYFYFRFILTYMTALDGSRSRRKWMREVERDSAMWAGAGVRVDRELLQYMAHEVTLEFLPDGMLHHTTFDSAQRWMGCRGPEALADIALSIAIDVTRDRLSARRRSLAQWEGLVADYDDEGEDDDDGEE